MATAVALSPRPSAAANVHSSPLRQWSQSHPTGLRRLKPKGSSRMDSLELSTAQSPREDPLRILDPAQKKLGTIEAQRVMAVMEEAMKRLERTLTLPFLAESLQRFSVPLGSELVSMLEEYHHLVSEYTSLLKVLEAQGITPKSSAEMVPGHTLSSTHIHTHSQEGTTSAVSVKSDISTGGRPVRLEPLREEDVDPEEMFYRVRDHLKHCVKSILRALNQSPSAPSLLETASKERSQPASSLVASMTDLRDVLRVRFLTTHGEQLRREEYLRKVAERQSSAEERIRGLELQLEAAQKQRDEEVAKRNAQIKQLKSSIKTVIDLAEDAKHRTQASASKQQEEQQKLHDAVAGKLSEDIATLRKDLQEKVTSNKEKEQGLRKRAFKRETEVENWIQKYDNEVGEKQEELEVLETEFEDEKKQVKELDEKLQYLSIEYNVVIKEQAEAKKRAEEADRRLRESVHAASVIQRCWRRYWCRRKEERKQKKGKGKKDKGKKKKK